MEVAAMKHKAQHERGGKRPRRVSISLLERIQPDAAGIDCGERSHFVAVPGDRDPAPVREFRTFTAELGRLADWVPGARATSRTASGSGSFTAWGYYAQA